MIEVHYTQSDTNAIHLAIDYQLAQSNRHLSRMLEDLKPRLVAAEDAFTAFAREWIAGGIAGHEAKLAAMTKKERRHYLRLHNPPPRRGRR